jgi:tRNA pseudouridine55 synthase
MSGFINLHKLTDWTSHDCVAKVRRLLNEKRVGHGGTLDPAATGVLPIAFGQATRLLQYLPQHKAYQAVIRLGIRTTTDDLAGDVLQASPVTGLSLETVRAALTQFQGTIRQIPPQYSAIQVDGKRLYDLARSGKAVEVPERTVEVSAIEVLNWSDGEFPELAVAIACGSGTYIRSIARDLGDVLQTGGTLAKLVRSQSCGFNLSESITLETLARQLELGTFQPISPDRAIQHLPIITLTAEVARRWCQGQKIPSDLFECSADIQSEALRVEDEQQTFLGIGKLRQVDEGDRGLILAPKLVLN